MDQLAIVPWQANIYTLSLFQYLMQNEEKVVLFLRETQEFSILEYIYQEKERLAIFLDRCKNTELFFFFCAGYAGSLFRGVIGSSNNCDFTFSCSRVPSAF